MASRGKIEDTGLYDYALKEIAKTYGQRVSFSDKAKGLDKFGRNTSVGTSFELVAELPAANETLPATQNLITHFSSSSASDTDDVIIEGHTVDAEGNMTFLVQTVTCAGQTKTALPTALFRVSRAYKAASGVFGTHPGPMVGTFYVYEDEAETAGVPNTAAHVHLTLQPGESQTFKAQTSISQYDYYCIDTLSAAVGDAGGSASYVTVRLERRDVKNGGPWLPVGRNVVIVPGQQETHIQFHPMRIIPPNHDIRVIAKTDANTADVEANFEGFLAIITG